MTIESPSILERLVRDNDLGWMIDMYSPQEHAIPLMLEKLTALTNEFQRRSRHVVSFTPEMLQAEAQRNPHKVRAFLQAFGTTTSTEMLLMVWRILQGFSIRDVTMRYHEQQSFRLDVTLAHADGAGDEVESYSTNNINDASLLRHFGIVEVNGQPFFDGFYPLRNR